MVNQLFIASLDSIILTDVDGIITRANPASYKMLGYDNGELIGKHASCLYADEEEAVRVMKELDTVGWFKGEIVSVTKDGREVVSLISANYIFNDKGELAGTMGISRDISFDVTIQQEYEQLANTISDIIYIANCEGKITYVNKTVNTLGYSSEELIGISLKDVIHETQWDTYNKQYTAHMEGKKTQSYLEFQGLKKDGSLVWLGQKMSTKFNVIHKNRIEGIYSVVRIIDKQKKTEILLAESEERYRELFDGSSDLIHSIDLEGNFLYVNQSWIKTTGYSQEELEEMNLFSLIHKESQEHCMKIVESILATGKSNNERILYSMVAKNGEKIIVEGALNVKLKDGLPVSIQSFLRDVTRQKEIEKKLIERERTLSQITETLNEVFYLYNLTEKKYDYISSNCKDVMGANEAFFLSGKSYTKKFGHPEDQEKLMEARKKINNGFSYNINYRIIIDTEIRWINEKSFPIKDDTGNFVANSGICRDITDLKIAEETIYRQNEEIGSSILYAQRLQDSVLPSVDTIRKIFPDSFVFHKPKNTLSGDFYIVDYIRNNNNVTMPAFIVGDCTGHGIPGAVLSLMCNVLIRESFTQREITSPSEALDFARNRLMRFFKSEKNGIINDGMDIAFCVLNKERNKLYFSGGYSSCVIVSEDELVEHKGDRQHIGYTTDPKPFTNLTIDVKKGDLVFLYSDGYVDQFGGIKDKKFSRKQLHKLILEMRHLPMQVMGTKLENIFNEWKNNTDQTDDVTVLGIRIE